MPKILISYRRADSDAIAGRIRDRLAGSYGDDSVFMDIDDIPFGIDFRQHIKDALLRNDLLIVVVGPRWLGTTKGSPPRLHEETDPVRVEVETALSRGIPVIPLLVHGANMPRAQDLPDSLKEFAYRNAAPVDTGRDFHQHMDRLIRSVDRIFQDKKKEGPGAVSDPVKASPTPGPVGPGSKPPTPEARTTTTKSESDAPVEPLAGLATVVGPAISAEPPPATPAKPSAVGQEPPVPPIVNDAAAMPRGGAEDVAARPVGRVPGGAPPLATSASVKTLVRGGETPAAAAGPSRQGVLLTAAACAAVIGAILIVYMTIPKVDRVVQTSPQQQQQKAPSQPSVQTKEQPQEQLPPAQLAALACKPDTAASFRDDFKAPRPGWDMGQLLRGSKASYSEGQMVLWAPEKASMAVLYTPLTFKNAAICAHVKAPQDEKTMAATGAGIIFWARDAYNYYVAGVHPDGSYGIYRYAGMSVSSLTPRARFESVKAGLGGVNEVAVVLNNNNGTLFINNVQVKDFGGQAPSAGGAVGLWMQSQQDQPNEWKFLDIAVVEPR
jgi:hypothetical protein